MNEEINNKLEKAFKRCSKASIEYEVAQDKMIQLLESQGIGTQTMRFSDAIGARLTYGEFESFDEFLSDLKRFKNGESVGYG